LNLPPRLPIVEHPGKAPSRAAGAALAHDSAVGHVSGRALYIDDLREPAGTVHVAPGYAPDTACGVITRLDLEPVRTAGGVVAVLTAADIPGVNDCSPAMGDDPILAEDRVLFHGQVVFAVVAETRHEARRAARLGVIEIEPASPVVTVDQGLAAGGEVLAPYEFRRGEPGAAIAAASHRLSGTLRVGGQEHFYLEGQVALAIPDENAMLVHSSTQHPTEIQHLVAKMLGISDAQVECVCRRMGGAFGGKESQAAQWACLAALAASLTGRPAKMRLDRDDDMILTGKRHDFRIDYEVGFDGDGRLAGVDVELASRCGCSADLSLGVNDRAMFHADNSYFYPAARIYSHRVKTNTVSNTAFRGFGGPQGMMFAERAMDAIACRLGLDPLDVRKRNLYGPGRSVTPYGMAVDDNIAPELIDELEHSCDYRVRRQAVRAFNAENTMLKKGLALTPVKFGISFTLVHLNQAGALVHVYTDGSVQVNHGGTEMGQGVYIKVAQVVAEVFGIDVGRVKITATTTAKVPNTAPTAASSGTDLNGMAAKRAAEAIKRRMADVAAKAHRSSRSDVIFAQDRVFVANHEMSFGDLAKNAFLARVPLSATGFYATPKITWHRDRREGRPFYYFAYGAACSEVTVDVTTGENRVDRVDILHDVGRSLNPAVDLGQIEGGFVQGMGWLTTEELVHDADGTLKTHAPSTYKIPTASDVPADLRVTFWRSKGNRQPTIYRSKAVGEPPLMLALSVFSAITDAIASLAPNVVPNLDAPATPETIMRAVKAMSAGNRGP
jgi:xanthine dehydrogenase large subunit